MSASVVSVRDELLLMGCGYQNLRHTYRAERVRFSEHSSVIVMSELHTTHLVLREFRDSDVDPLYEIQGNPDYMRLTFAMPENRASARVLEKCRFKFLCYECILRRNHYALRVEDW